MKLSILQALWNSIIKIIVINYTFLSLLCCLFCNFFNNATLFFEKDELFSIFFINALLPPTKKVFLHVWWNILAWLLNSEELVKKVDFDFKFGKWNELFVRKRPATELSFLISPFCHFWFTREEKELYFSVNYVIVLLLLRRRHVLPLSLCTVY